MLPEYLMISYAAEQKKEASADLTSLLKKLPNEELYKIATGETKFAYGASECWLESFKGTPFFERAVQLEQQDLQLQMAEQQRREVRSADEDLWAQRDKLSIQRRLLGIEKTQWEEQSQGGMPGPEGLAGPPVEPPVLEQPQQPPAVEKQSAASPKGDAGLKTASGQNIVVQSNKETIGAEEKNQGAGQLGAFGMDTTEHMDTVWAGKKQAAIEKIATVDALARKLAQADLKKPMNPILARKELSDEIEEAMANTIGFGEKVPLNQVRDIAGLAMDYAHQTRNSMQEGTEFAEKHPVLNRLRGGAVIGMLGGMVGLPIGAISPTGIKGKLGIIAGSALLGGAIGTVVTKGAKGRREDLNHYTHAMNSLGERGIENAVLSAVVNHNANIDQRRRVDVASASAPKTHVTQVSWQEREKKSSHRMLEEVGGYAGVILAKLAAGPLASMAQSVLGRAARTGAVSGAPALAAGAKLMTPSSQAAAKLMAPAGRATPALAPGVSTGGVLGIGAKSAPALPTPAPMATGAKALPAPPPRAAAPTAAPTTEAPSGIWSRMTPGQKGLAIGGGALAGGYLMGKASSAKQADAGGMAAKLIPHKLGLRSASPHKLGLLKPLKEVEKAGSIEKNALVPGLGTAMLAGLKGMGQFGKQFGGGVMQAGRIGGLKGAGQAAGLGLTSGVQRAAEFAKANPLAAAALAGGGLGAAGLTGAALS